jgi:DNA polymerase-3 subunit gamma/tau
MVLIRIAYTGDMPTPDEIIKAIGGGAGRDQANGAATRTASANGQSAPQGSEATRSEGTRMSGRGGGAQPLQAVAAPSLTPDRAQAPAAQRQAAVALNTFDDVLALCSQRRDIQLRVHLEDNVSLISFAPGHIEVFPLEAAPKGLAGELGRKLSEWTGDRWVVSVGREMGAPPIGEVIRAERQRRIDQAAKDPAIAPLLEAFPDAKIIDVSDSATDNDDNA